MESCLKISFLKLKDSIRDSTKFNVLVILVQLRHTQPFLWNVLGLTERSRYKRIISILALAKILSKFHDILSSRSHVIDLKVTLPLLLLFGMKKVERDGKNTAKAKQWLDKYHDKFAPAYSMFKYRFIEFRRKRTSWVINSERLIRDNNVRKHRNIKEIVLADRKIYWIELVNVIGI